MKQTCILWAMAWGMAVVAVDVFGQQKVIQPSPAYYQQGAAPVMVQPVVYPAAPVPVQPRPVQAAPKPVSVQPRSLPRTPQPLAVQPRPIPRTSQPLAVQPRPGPKAPQPLAVQPRPGQRAPQPLAVQPRPGQRAPQPLAVQPRPISPAPQPIPVQRTIQPRPVLAAPPVQPVAPVVAQPVYYVPAPVQPVYYAPAPAPQPVVLQPAPVVFPAEPVHAVYPPAQPEPMVFDEEVDAVPVYDESSRPRLALAPDQRALYEEHLDDYEGQESTWPGLGLGAKIGTTGLGLDLIVGVNRFLNLRGGFNYGYFSLNSSFGDVDYDMEVDLITAPLMVDIHPFGNHFRISAGAYIQPGTQADIRSTPSGTTQIGYHTYSSEVVGTLTGEIEMADLFTPYLGIGFGNAVGEDQALTFLFDIGVIFQSYDVSLSSDGAGMTAVNDAFRNDLELEEKNLQDELDSFKIFPVLTFGMAYHF